ncbi:MAG: hypothetical protein ACPGVN_00470 [Alphaproteobacteria bacterium]
MFAFTKKFGLAFAVSVLVLGLSVTQPVLAVDKAVTAVKNGQKSAARAIMLKRTVWGHFRAMDADNSWSLTYPEMNVYFTAMHIAFDANNNGVVSVREAPKIMLKYTLSGEPFPNNGLNLSTLRGRLQRLFNVLDKNRNRVLSVSELT